MNKVDFLSKLNTEDVSWIIIFLELCYEGWLWKKAAFIAWSSTPKRTRKPGTLNELSEWLGYSSPSTVCRWKQRDPEVRERVKNIQFDKLSENRSDVFNTLAEMAQRPNAKSHPDRKLFLEMTGDYERNKEVLTWQDEVAAAGLSINAKQIYQQLVFQFVAAIEPRSELNDPRRLEVGSGVDPSSEG